MTAKVFAICLYLFPVVWWAGCSVSKERQAYLNAGCPRCHGSDRSGGPQGPPLKGLKANWTREEILLFLKDPARNRDARLKALSDRYNAQMPTFALAEETRRMLADYLLNEE